jgi:tetratricopeptide (TPR) repeat protein
MSKIGQDDEPVVTISERLGKLEGQLAALKATVETKRPWYKDASSLVAILAFIFSLGTTVVSYVRTEQQDVHNARMELQGYMEKLSTLPKDSYTFFKEFQNQPQILADLNGYLNGQRIYYAHRAAETIDRIPDQVSSTEANFVALALFQSGMYTQGARVATAAIAKARDYLDAVAAYRNYGCYLILQGKFQEGRDQLQSALEIFSNPRFFEPNEDAKNVTSFETELYWAQAEANARQIDEAKKHIDRAQACLGKMPPGPGRDYNAERVAKIQLGPPSTSVGAELQHPPILKGP